jgi:hypothetical protein
MQVELTVGEVQLVCVALAFSDVRRDSGREREQDRAK